MTSEDVGKKSRTEACVDKLSELNPYVHVARVTGDIVSLDVLKKFGVVVVTHTDALGKAQLIEMNELCRANGITFIMALTYGVTSVFFSDFGDTHIVTDSDGEPKKSHVIEDITEDGIVTIAGKRHGFDDGDHVTFEEVEGMEVLNAIGDVKIKRVYSKVQRRLLILATTAVL